MTSILKSAFLRPWRTVFAASLLLVSPVNADARSGHFLPIFSAELLSQSESPNQAESTAMIAYNKGVALYNKAEYEAALEAFFDAQSLYPSPDFQYNIARCYERIQKYEEAIRYYQAYIRNKPDADDRANVEDQIDQLKARLQTQQQVHSQKPIQPSPSPTVPPKSSRPLIISGSVLLGVGAAFALGGGVGFGVQASNRQQKVDDINAGQNPDNLTLAQALALEKQGKMAQTLQIVSISVGAAVAITGGALLGVGLRRRMQQHQTALLPSVGPHMTGLIFQGRF